jgi:anti-sigma regulatory factor (Ser/Thr protein kinase)
MSGICMHRNEVSRAAERGADVHQALFYENEREYLDGVLGFITPALDAEEPVAAAVPPGRGELLRDALNGTAADVEILDMYELGRNPSRIIPAVEQMLAKHAGARLHYIGEPIWPGRSEEEIREATKHEALINLAWPGAPIRVLCPYDAVGLEPHVLADAERTHPCLIRGGAEVPSPAYDGPAIPFGSDEALAPPPPEAISLAFGLEDLPSARMLVLDQATRIGLATQRTEDLVLAVNELATNAVRHGQGGGVLQMWNHRGKLVCQIEDRGYITDLLAGRRMPAPDSAGGMGLWLVNQLCDLVEVRSFADGTTVRVHAALD